MLVKTSELTGAALDWVVAKCEGIDFTEGGIFHEINNFIGRRSVAGKANWSINWAQGGPIIEREKIEVSPAAGAWCSLPDRINYPNCNAPLFFGPTPLIAAMRCYVASKLGDTVEIPDELFA